MTSPLLLPVPLCPGDTLAVVAPAGQMRDRQVVEAGLQVLHDMGFKVKLPRDFWPGNGYLADTDAHRADEIHRMLADSEVKGLIALRGGYGCLRLLPYLDFTLFRQNQKILVGFSDISILLNQVVDRAHLVTFHGPVVTTLGKASPAARERLYLSLTGKWAGGMATPQMELIRGAALTTGRLMGGNLNSLVSLLGTPFDHSWQDAILLLEDIHEPLYKIDRMLTQLFLAGKFQGIKGLLIGDFTLDRDQDALARMRYTEAIWNRMIELVENPTIPIWAGLPFGHLPENLTLPIGSQVTMDSDLGRLVFH